MLRKLQEATASADATTPAADGTTTPPADGTTTPPADGTTTPAADGTTTPAADGTTTPAADGTTTPATIPKVCLAIKPPKSKCPPPDKKCIAKEEAAHQQLIDACVEAEKGKYHPPEQKAFEATVGSTTLVCNMDGYTKMIKELTEVLFAAIAIVKETAMEFIPENFRKAIQFAWVGGVGIGNWMGYVLAALQFLAEEGQFGQDFCDAMSYGYVAIDELHVIVSFADDTSTETDITKLASNAAKEAAAGNALDAALATKAAVEEAQKKEVQAAIDAGQTPPTADGSASASASAQPADGSASASADASAQPAASS